MADQLRPASDPGAAMKTPAPRFWMIEPVASLDDSRWQDRPIWRVLVTAPISSLALQAAEAWANPRGAAQIGNESDSPLAGFADEKLYRVREVPPDPAWQGSGSSTDRAVVDAELLRKAPDIIEI